MWTTTANRSRMINRSTTTTTTNSLALSILSLYAIFHTTPVWVWGQTVLSPVQLYTGIQNNQFAAVIDVRTQSEWDTGHINNATFVDSLSSLAYIPDDIIGCKCGDGMKEIVVYCRTGGRASDAIDLMLLNGFNQSNIILYNGQGVNQWIDAGYELMLNPSIEASCSDDGVVDEMGACVTASAMPTTPSTNSTSIDPVPTPTVSPIQLTITNPTTSPIEQNPSSTASASFKRLSSSFTVFQFLSSLLFIICL